MLGVSCGCTALLERTGGDSEWRYRIGLLKPAGISLLAPLTASAQAAQACFAMAQAGAGVALKWSFMSHGWCRAVSSSLPSLHPSGLSSLHGPHRRQSSPWEEELPPNALGTSCFLSREERRWGLGVSGGKEHPSLASVLGLQDREC